MDVLVTVDFMFLYYKYKFIIESGRIRKLSYNGVDTSNIYYPIKEIEGFRKYWMERGHNVTTAVCFDMPSIRKDDGTEEAEKYKSNRGHKLSDEDFENIIKCYNILTKAGYNTFRLEGYEADDIINHIVKNCLAEYDAAVIYTPDADIMVNIGPKVAVMRYKSSRGYEFVTVNNFETYLSAELKCE
ncbi:MAG: hypothetical protein IJ593_05290, partial [Lachnospiraceae bacterium]|nr:hypothetical protein [Lachnospiraceae bacterium]